MKLKLKIWRQESPEAKGGIKTYDLDGVSGDMSFLEMLDVLNEELILKNEEPVAFDHDCREGICGSCDLMINGEAHGPEVTTTCQLHMRSFKDGDEIVIEPWRADSFPVVKDLIVDRSAFDRIIQAGVRIWQGDHEDAHANEQLGEFTFSGLRQGPSGNVRVEITFDVSVEGILTMTARDPDTGKNMKTTVRVTQS